MYLSVFASVSILNSSKLSQAALKIGAALGKARVTTAGGPTGSSTHVPAAVTTAAAAAAKKRNRLGFTRRGRKRSATVVPASGALVTAAGNELKTKMASNVPVDDGVEEMETETSPELNIGESFRAHIGLHLN